MANRAGFGGPGGQVDRHGGDDPSFVVTHRLPASEAPMAYDMFLKERDNCEKVVLLA